MLSAAGSLQGMQLWAGVKRHSVEIPIADQAPAAQLAVAQALLASFPAAAGLPVVIFGSQEATEHARATNAPFSVYSVDEAAAPPEDEDDDLRGPLLIFGSSYDQAAACQTIIDELWSGRLVVVANAGWLRDEPPAAVQALAASLNPVYFFLPVSFSVRACAACKHENDAQGVLGDLATATVALDHWNRCTSSCLPRSLACFFLPVSIPEAGVRGACVGHAGWWQGGVPVQVDTEPRVGQVGFLSVREEQHAHGGPDGQEADK